MLIGFDLLGFLLVAERPDWFQFGSIDTDIYFATEVDPGIGTRGLIGKLAVLLLNGADHDEENETDD